MQKTYQAEVTLGAQTDTWDSEGEVVETAPVPNITLEDIKAALETMTGEITHPIPYYSAKKINGKAMYKEARNGNNIERQSNVTIYKWEEVRLEGNKIKFTVECGSGTYVRSLAHMLGMKLGTLGHISILRRTKIGGYDAKDALKMDNIKTAAREDILKCVKIL
jgi:tRNA pseudouridine55 synthase